MECMVSKLDHFGNGISKIDNKVIFINRALINEIVDIAIVKDKKKFSVAKINKIIKESPLRVKPICPYYDFCGGCDFLHTTYDNEINFKKEKGNNVLGHIDGFYPTSNMNYRNKVTLHVNKKEIGFYKEKTNQIIDINFCYLLNDKLNEVLDLLNKYVKEYSHNITEVVIKTNGINTLMDVVGSIESSFLPYFSMVDVIINNDKIIKGIGYIEDNINNYKFKISSKSFFQVNKEGLQNISNIIKIYLENQKYHNALDLYSGTSTLGIIISPYVDRVTSIEINKSATMDALINKESNHITNLEVICGKVEKYIDQFKNIDLIIIDPPRSGMDKKTINNLLRIKAKKIIYVSCDMLTLKRDIDDLSVLYDVKQINLVDMFKRTYHVECVSVLHRKSVEK